MSEVPDYTGHHEAVGTSDMLLLSTLMEELEIAKAEEAHAMEALKSKTKRVTELEQYEIPELMLALNTRKHETASGLSISLNETIRCSIPHSNKPKCMKWLIDNGHSALIKDTVTVEFNVDQHEDAVLLKERLLGEHSHVLQDQKVESSTIRAFIKKQLANGVDFPMEMFGAFQQMKAVIKLKRQARQF